MSRSTESSLPRRRQANGGYARGEQTRMRLVQASLKVFGEQGYAQASTRLIAAAADTNPPALQYYFDGKEGLHLACGEFIVERMSQDLREPIAIAKKAVKAGGITSAAAALCELLDTMLRLSLESADAPILYRFIGRAQTEKVGPAYPLVREHILLPLFDVCSALVAVATTSTRKNPDVSLLTMFLINQLTAFTIQRDDTLASLGWKDLKGQRGRDVRRMVKRVVLGALGPLTD